MLCRSGLLWKVFPTSIPPGFAGQKNKEIYVRPNLYMSLMLRSYVVTAFDERELGAAGCLNRKPTQNYLKQRSEKVRQKLLNGFEMQSAFFKNSNCLYGMCQLT